MLTVIKSTSMLLARLEQENAKLATNPKSAKAKVVQETAARTSMLPGTRPPSMAQLRTMVNGPTPPALRYSMLPPPPMTDLEFYAAPGQGLPANSSKATDSTVKKGTKRYTASSTGGRLAEHGRCQGYCFGADI